MDSLDSFFSRDGAESKPSDSDIYVDEEGDWYYQGNKLIRPDIIELFLDNVHTRPEGTFFIQWRGLSCDIHSADTPFVVARVDRGESSAAGKPEEILLTFRHLPTQEPLSPETLWVGKGNVLYCRVRGGRFPARFSRPAYYQVAEWIEEDPRTGAFYVEQNGIRHHIETRCAENE